MEQVWKWFFQYDLWNRDFRAPCDREHNISLMSFDKNSTFGYFVWIMSHADIFWRSGCVSEPTRKLSQKTSIRLPHRGVPGRADPTPDVVKCAVSPLAAPGKTRALLEPSVLDVGANVVGGFVRQNVDVAVDFVVDAVDVAVDAVDVAVHVVVDVVDAVDVAVDVVVDAVDVAVDVVVDAVDAVDVVDVVVDAVDVAVDVVDVVVDAVDVAGVPAGTDADVVKVHVVTYMAGTQDAVAFVGAFGDVVAAPGYVLGVDASVDAADALTQASNEVAHHSEPWTIKKLQLCVCFFSILFHICVLTNISDHVNFLRFFRTPFHAKQGTGCGGSCRACVRPRSKCWSNWSLWRASFLWIHNCCSLCLLSHQQKSLRTELSPSSIIFTRKVCHASSHEKKVWLKKNIKHQNIIFFILHPPFFSKAQVSGGIRGTAGSIDTLGPSTGMDLLGRSTGAEIGVPGKEAMLRFFVGFSWSFAKTRSWSLECFGLEKTGSFGM